jgi:hypothetical protein
MPTPYSNALSTLRSGTPIAFSSALFHASLKPEGGLYVVLEQNRRRWRIIYCGKGKNLRNRLYGNLLNGQTRSHTLSAKLIKRRSLRTKGSVKRYLKEECAVRCYYEHNAREKSLAEHYCISMFRPEMND